MRQAIRTFSNTIDTISVFCAVVAVFMILIISIYGAFFRYILNDPLAWPLPVERLLMVWAALLGIPAALKRGQHMGVEGLLHCLPAGLERSIRYSNYAMVALFIFCLGWYGWQEVLSSNDFYMIDAQTRISSRWLVAAVPISAIIQGIHLATVPEIIDKEMAKREETVKERQKKGETTCHL